MTMSSQFSITEQIIAECRDDYVGLWSIVRRIRNAGMSENVKAIETTLALLTELLTQRRIIVGQFVDHEFREWKMNPEEVVVKIQREWTELGRDPNIGEIAWFVAARGLQ